MSDSPGPPFESRILTDEIVQRISRETKVHLNLAQDMIVTNEDKVRLCLTSHLSRVEAKRGWIAPFAIFVSILLTLVTAQFHDLYLSASAWKAMFIWALILDSVWLGRALLSVRKSSGVDDIVAEMKRVGTLRASVGPEAAASVDTGPLPTTARSATLTVSQIESIKTAAFGKSKLVASCLDAACSWSLEGKLIHLTFERKNAWAADMLKGHESFDRLCSICERALGYPVDISIRVKEPGDS